MVNTLKKATILSDGTKIDYKDLHVLLMEGVKKFDTIHEEYEKLLVKFVLLLFLRIKKY
ncbi:hypothetical protein DSECCO2_294500 [anaerobic digester metagenome]